jgi:hypothetical protein
MTHTEIVAAIAFRLFREGTGSKKVCEAIAELIADDLVEAGVLNATEAE